jgi:hypothetical protein
VELTVMSNWLPNRLFGPTDVPSSVLHHRSWTLASNRCFDLREKRRSHLQARCQTGWIDRQGACPRIDGDSGQRNPMSDDYLAEALEHRNQPWFQLRLIVCRNGQIRKSSQFVGRAYRRCILQGDPSEDVHRLDDLYVASGRAEIAAGDVIGA